MERQDIQNILKKIGKLANTVNDADTWKTIEKLVDEKFEEISLYERYLISDERSPLLGYFSVLPVELLTGILRIVSTDCLRLITNSCSSFFSTLDNSGEDTDYIWFSSLERYSRESSLAPETLQFVHPLKDLTWSAQKIGWKKTSRVFQLESLKTPIDSWRIVEEPDPQGDPYDRNSKDALYQGPSSLVTANGVSTRVKQGHGLLSTPSGYYEGNFLNNMFNGSGLAVVNNYSRMRGVWKDNIPQGVFEIHYADGGVYNGTYGGYGKEGYGTFFFPNGDVYEGTFAEDEFENGVMKYTKDNNKGYEKYEGEWRSNKKSGRGIMDYSNGDVYMGKWENDEQVKGTMKYNDGSVYKGEWDGLDRRGVGKFVSADKKTELYGVWKRDKLRTEFDRDRINEYVKEKKDKKDEKRKKAEKRENSRKKRRTTYTGADRVD